MPAKAGVTGDYLVAHPNEMKIRVEYLIKTGHLDREDVGDINKLNEIDGSLISMLYDLANDQFEVSHDDEHGNWNGLINESYENAMIRHNDLLNQPIDEDIDEEDILNQPIEDYDEYDEDDFDVDDLLNQPITEEVHREIEYVDHVDSFMNNWNKLTNDASLDKISEYLIDNFDVNNPILKKKNYSKGKDEKFKYLNSARKLRWDADRNQPSRNGKMRVINAYIPNKKAVYLIFCYHKKNQPDITKLQATMISKAIERLIKEDD